MIKREGLRPLKTLFLILGEIPWDIKMTTRIGCSLKKKVI